MRAPTHLPDSRKILVATSLLNKIPLQVEDRVRRRPSISATDRYISVMQSLRPWWKAFVAFECKAAIIA